MSDEKVAVPGSDTDGSLFLSFDVFLRLRFFGLLLVGFRKLGLLLRKTLNLG